MFLIETLKQPPENRKHDIQSVCYKLDTYNLLLESSLALPFITSFTFENGG